MRRSSRIAFAAIVFVGAAAGAEPAAAPVTEDFAPDTPHMLRGTADGQLERCRLLGYVFYRLAEQRDAGAERPAAEESAERWLRQWQSTGTHLAGDYRGLVKPAASFVYQQKALTPSAHGYMAYDTCELEAAFGTDESRKNAGVAQLVKATMACQARFPEPRNNHEIGHCLRGEREAIVQRLQPAPVTAKK